MYPNMNAYKDWCVNNITGMKSLESAIHVTTYSITEVLQKLLKCEIPSEIVHCCSSLLPLFNDQVIISSKPDWNFLRPSNYVIRMVLAVSAQLEFLMESLFEKCGPKYKKILIVIYLAIKCLLSVLLLNRQSSEIISDPPGFLIDREKLTQLVYLEQYNYIYNVKMTGRILKTVERGRELKEYLPLEALSIQNKNPMTERDQFYHMIAEVLHVFKPLVSILAFYKFEKTSWIPLCIYFLIEKLSMLLHSWKSKRSNSCEKELSKRRLSIFLYFLRSPLYEKGLKSLLEHYKKSSFKIIHSLSSLLLASTSYCNKKDLYIWS